ncbi:hypothetical protein FRB96_003491 [Tulasnella sp. 330]|nr:hypothetical protein FRB96_003491 [Tulasnella sp. 330]KAG8885497.1 hypothetical protein FRB97_000821 [Tulasnella sp. 331]
MLQLTLPFIMTKAWYQERGAGAAPATQTVGRSFYTSLGHLSSTWKDPTFMEHIMAGVMWALGSKANSSDAADTQSEHGTSRTTTLES